MLFTFFLLCKSLPFKKPTLKRGVSPISEAAFPLYFPKILDALLQEVKFEDINSCRTYWSFNWPGYWDCCFSK